MDSLDAEDMTDLFTADYNIRTRFKGVYAIDEIPRLKTDKLVVVNLDPSNMPGSHWTVIYNKEGSVIEYFDSRGMKPPRSVADYLLSYTKECIYSTRRLQQYQTSSCGLFCLYYSFYASRKCDLQHIVNNFHDNLNINEYIVANFAKHYTLMYNI